LQTPVALIIFNRPHTTERVFAEIAKVKPLKLFVIADGPRADHPEDLKKCVAARAIIEKVDWECDVLKNYSEANLGCGKRPATGIDWVFEHVDRCIIIEDDCIPHPTFFQCCDELLEKYKDDERVMQVCGTDLQFGQSQISCSYYFSRHNICFGGWATWRRAWKNFDIKIERWSSLRDTSWLKDFLREPLAVEYWQNIFDDAYKHAGDVDYWDYQWRFAFWCKGGLAIMPKQSLISNIGFGQAATHTTSANHEFANIERIAMAFPIIHPPGVEINQLADRFMIERFVREQQKKLITKSSRRISAVIPRSVRKLLFYLFPRRY